MEKTKVSFRLDSDKVGALDGLAKALDRNRTYLLNEAVAAYLEVQQWQIEHIQSSIKQANARQPIGHKEVKRMGAKWRRRR